MLDNLQKIVIEKPVDKIIDQIRFLITSGELKPRRQTSSREKTSRQFRSGQRPST